MNDVLTKPFADTVRERAAIDPAFVAALAEDMALVPSTELRNTAAELHDNMTKAEDFYRMERDGEMDLRGLGYNMATRHAAIYEEFCREHCLRLMTDASGLFLRCGETGIPLVETDEYLENNDGQLVLVKQAA